MNNSPIHIIQVKSKIKLESDIEKQYTVLKKVLKEKSKHIHIMHLDKITFVFLT